MSISREHAPRVFCAGLEPSFLCLGVIAFLVAPAVTKLQLRLHLDKNNNNKQIGKAVTELEKNNALVQVHIPDAISLLLTQII